MKKLLWLICLWPSLAWGQGQCIVPPQAAATPIVSQTLSSAVVAKAAPGCLLSGYVVANTAAAGFLMVLNSATVPADGAVKPLECVPVNANSYNFINLAPQPSEWYSAGIILAYSSTGCLTKTTSDTVWFHALVQ